MRTAGTVAAVAAVCGVMVSGGCVFDTSDGGPNSKAYESRAYSTKTGLNAERPIFPRPYEGDGAGDVAEGSFATGAWMAGDVFITGQPDEAALRRLIENEGVTLIVNLRTPAEMDRLRTDATAPFDEAAFLRPYTVSHGVEYVELPIGGEDHPPTPGQVDEFAEALARHDTRALLKCASAGRASQMWAAYLVRRWGFDVNEARRHAGAMNFGPTTMEQLLGVEFDVSTRVP